MVFSNCPICKEDGHPTYKCEKLIQLTVPHRINAVKTANLCLICLRTNHQTNECIKRNCFKCGKVHHHILHLKKTENLNEPQQDAWLASSPNQRNNSIVLLNQSKVEELMVTATINILDKKIRPIPHHRTVSTNSWPPPTTIFNISRWSGRYSNINITQDHRNYPIQV